MSPAPSLGAGFPLPWLASQPRALEVHITVPSPTLHISSMDMLLVFELDCVFLVFSLYLLLPWVWSKGAKRCLG